MFTLANSGHDTNNVPDINKCSYTTNSKILINLNLHKLSLNIVLTQEMLSQHGCVAQHLNDAVHEARVAQILQTRKTWTHSARKHIVRYRTRRRRSAVDRGDFTRRLLR